MLEHPFYPFNFSGLGIGITVSMKASRRLLVSSKVISEACCRQRLLQSSFVPLKQLPFNAVSPLRCSVSQFSSASSSTPPSVPVERNIPTKEVLLRVDWMLEHMLPGMMKAPLKPFFAMLDNDMQFEDKLFNYKFSSRSSLFNHIAKLRMYFRYKSPYNKMEYTGSCVYEGEDVVVILWRLSYLESNFWTYLPSFMTKKEPKINVLEGALDVHVSKQGMVYKILNRKVTASDLEGAKVMSQLKKDQGDKLLADEEREWRKSMKEQFENERRMGMF